MGLLVHRRLAIPLSAIAFFTVALTATAAVRLLLMPPITVFVVAALGITALVFLTSGAIPFLRASRSLVRVPPSRKWEQASPRIAIAGGIWVSMPEQPNRDAVDEELDLVRMDDDGGWQMPRLPAGSSDNRPNHPSSLLQLSQLKATGKTYPLRAPAAE